MLQVANAADVKIPNATWAFSKSSDFYFVDISRISTPDVFAQPSAAAEAKSGKTVFRYFPVKSNNNGI